MLKEIIQEELGYANLASEQLRNLSLNKLFDVCYDIERSVSDKFDFKSPYYIKI